MASEEAWDGLADKVSARLGCGMKFYDAVDAALKEAGIDVGNDFEKKRFFCKRLGQRLGRRRRGR